MPRSIRIIVTVLVASLALSSDAWGGTRPKNRKRTTKRELKKPFNAMADPRLAPRFNRTIMTRVKHMKLRRIVESNYRRDARVGTGSTASAVQSYLKTKRGKPHLQKAVDSLKAVREVLRRPHGKIRVPRAARLRTRFRAHALKRLRNNDLLVARHLEATLGRALREAHAKGLIRRNGRRWGFLGEK